MTQEEKLKQLMESATALLPDRMHPAYVNGWNDSKNFILLAANRVYKDDLRYIVPLPGLKTTDGEQQYLTSKDGTFFACRRNEKLRQTWKREHLKYIPKEYRAFAVEVE